MNTRELEKRERDKLLREHSERARERKVERERFVARAIPELSLLRVLAEN